MTRHLLDVNVLLALIWPRHENHAAAHAWFAKSSQQGWATNPLTQLGVLRLLTNPAVTQGAVSAAVALDILGKLTSHAGHAFWPLDRDLSLGLQPVAARVRGHRLWTDMVLLWHAKERDGVLVTFDSSVRELAAGELMAFVQVLKRR